MLNAFLDTLLTKTTFNAWEKEVIVSVFSVVTKTENKTKQKNKTKTKKQKNHLQHVLNNCKTMLDPCRYTWPHNSVLHINIMDTLRDQSWN